jgi:hypothetical protein
MVRRRTAGPSDGLSLAHGHLPQLLLER